MLLDPIWSSNLIQKILLIIQVSIHSCSQPVLIAMKGFQSSWHCTGKCCQWFSCLMVSFLFWDLLVACHQLEVHPTHADPHQEQRRLPCWSLAPWLAWLRNWSQCRACWVVGWRRCLMQRRIIIVTIISWQQLITINNQRNLLKATSTLHIPYI